MSFSVKAGGSPPVPAAASNPNYVSPSLLPQSSYRSAASGSLRDPPPFNLADQDGGNSGGKRVGTDPTKYKTTICRNWEQSGGCSFRGCTFAHGIEELRPHLRNVSPPLQPQHQPSPGTTPPLYPGLPPQSTQQQQQQVPQLPPSGPQRVEYLVELLVAEVAKERDLVNVHVEANKTLEVMLRREQVLHADTAAQVDGLAAQVSDLHRLVAERNQEILNLLEAGGSKIGPEMHTRAMALTRFNPKDGRQWTPEPERQGSGDVGGPSARRSLPPPPPPPGPPPQTGLKPIDESPNSGSKPTFFSSSSAGRQAQQLLDDEDEFKLRDLLDALRQQGN